jgi:hypothetical protein
VTSYYKQLKEKIMNDEQANQGKDFRSLLGQMTNHSETRDKMISEIDEIIDRIKMNRAPSVTEKGNALTKDSVEVVSQFRNVVRGMDLANERIAMIIRRLSELV